MMDAIAAITMLALAVWLIRGRPRRRLTDEEILANRKRIAIQKANEAYENTPHWWAR